MNCSIQGCPGQYEEKTIIQTLRKGGEVFVFEQLPAEVCSVCGDNLLKPETVRQLERLLQAKRRPDESPRKLAKT